MRLKVLDTLQKYGMLQPGDFLIVGLSGGADSVALLHCLASLRDTVNFSLRACHVNHQIRGGEAYRDQAFCERLCKELGISLTVWLKDVPGFAEKQSLGLEEAARELRYSCFFQAAEEWRSQLHPTASVKIATAHTLSDSLETVLFSMVRGTGLAGLCGIPPIRISSGAGQPNVIRPLIETTRLETEEYCRKNQLEYMTDSTNSDERYTRNKIRRQIVPLLREINPSIEQAAARMTESLREDRECLDSMTKDFFQRYGLENIGQYERGNLVLDGVSRAPWLELPQGLAVRVIQKMLINSGLDYDRKRLFLCRETAYKGCGAVEIQKGFYIKATADRIQLEKRMEPEPYFEIPIQLVGQSAEQTVQVSGKIYTLRLLDYEQTEKFKKISPNGLKNCLDYAKIYGIVKLRQRKNGDAYIPWKRSGSHSLKKLFQEKGIPPLERSRLAILEDGGGILWTERIGCSQRAAPGPDTHYLLEICVPEQTEGSPSLQSEAKME